jgi:hypothetical protein
MATSVSGALSIKQFPSSQWGRGSLLSVSFNCHRLPRTLPLSAHETASTTSSRCICTADIFREIKILLVIVRPISKSFGRPLPMPSAQWHVGALSSATGIKSCKVRLVHGMIPSSKSLKATKRTAIRSTKRLVMQFQLSALQSAPRKSVSKAGSAPFYLLNQRHIM